jgi:hypothetical protein
VDWRDSGGISINGRASDAVTIPINQARRAYNLGNTVHLLCFTAKEGITMSDVTPRVREIISRQHFIDPEDEQAMFLLNTQLIFGIVDNLFKGINFLIWLIGLGTLLAGVIGVSNIMMVSVKERTTEIGIRRAIGARRASIVTQFLMESAMICGIGGIFGILLGYVGTVVAGRLIVNMPLYPSPLITLGAFGFSVLLGMIFGMYPAIKASGLDSIGVGKIYDIFAGIGTTEHVYNQSNANGMEHTTNYAAKDFQGLCFVNLVDFDMVYGHRRNIDGYAQALSEFDAWLGDFLPTLHEDDLVLITADHGCDPGYTATTDHTREHVPLLILGKAVKPVNLGTRHGFCDIAATVAELLDVDLETSGVSFAEEIL